MMDNNRVLVTGGAGVIGSNLANHLADQNEVIAVDDGYLGTPENLAAAVEFHDRSVLEDDLPTDVDVVFHLAALSSYAMHEDDPARGARVNVEGFVNTIEQARADGCETIVYASTSSIYGSRTEPPPVDMEVAVNKVAVNTGYEASKLARERYGEYVATHYDMHVAGMRFFSVSQGYGGAEAHTGEYANVIAQFADDLANGDAPVLYGDGTQTRDLTHVSDIVRGLELAAEHDLTGSTTSARATPTASPTSSRCSTRNWGPISSPSTSRTRSPTTATSTTPVPIRRRSKPRPGGHPRSTSKRACGASVHSIPTGQRRRKPRQSRPPSSPSAVFLRTKLARCCGSHPLRSLSQ